MKDSYQILDVDSPDGWAIVEITDGPWTGVKYTYKKVGFNFKGVFLQSPTLSYNYQLIEQEDIKNPESQKEIEEFEDIIGDILVDIIQDLKE